MSLEPTLTRRTVLAAGVVVGAAGIGALAGCAANAKSATGAGAAATPTGAGNGQPAADIVLAKVSDVPVGGAISASLDNKPILISRPAAGTVIAFSAICTHMGCTVAPAGKDFVCPCHGSTYDMKTGAVKVGPAPAPLPKVAVHVTDGEVMSGS